MWTAKVVGVSKNKDGLTFSLSYMLTDGQAVQMVTEPLVSSADSIAQILSDAENTINRKATQLSVIGKLNTGDYVGKTAAQLRKADEDAKAPPPLTSDALALLFWKSAKAEWEKRVKVLASGLSKVLTQKDVDEAYAMMKSLYKEEYGAFL